MELIYTSCPECGDDLPYALAPGNLHRISHPRCKARFVISTDPSGDDHEVRVLEMGETWEEAIRDLYPTHKDRLQRGVFLEAAQERAG